MRSSDLRRRTSVVGEDTSDNANNNTAMLSSCNSGSSANEHLPPSNQDASGRTSITSSLQHVTTTTTSPKKQSPLSPFWDDWKSHNNDDDDDNDDLETTSEILFGGREEEEVETSSSSEEEEFCPIQSNRHNKPMRCSSSSSSSSSSSFVCHDHIRSSSSLEEEEHHPSQQDLETIKYMAKREMTVQQERWNAITILPNAMYCLYFLLSAKWMPINLSNGEDGDENYILNGRLDIDEDSNQEHGCLAPNHWLARLFQWTVLPPLPIVAVAMGICFHAPFSFLYHWRYATQRVPTTHWSRRMDQAMIHVCSALVSYSTSGDVRYFLVNVLYNTECIIRQFCKRVQPKRNQRRIIFSMIFYLLPLLRRQQFEIFIELVIVLGISGWFFVAYPIGGWSHATFHLVVSLVPPLLMAAALDLPQSVVQVQSAMQCQRKYPPLTIHDM